MKTKTKLIIIGIGLIICLVIAYLNYNHKPNDFFKEHNIKDKCPVGFIQNQWYYLTYDNQTYNTSEEPLSDCKFIDLVKE